MRVLSMSKKVPPHEALCVCPNPDFNMRSYRAAMLASTYLIHTYVMHRSLYTSLQLRKTGTQFSGQQPVLNAQASSSDAPHSL